MEMGTIVVVNNVTLDGVTQGFGRPDEDTRAGFQLGGWGWPYADEVIGREMGAAMSQPGVMLFGRYTFELLHASWADRDDGNRYTEVLNSRPKYVVSTTLREPLVWQNSHLIGSDHAAAVRRLRHDVPGLIAVLGSGQLVRMLVEEDLVDEYQLLIHPLLLGDGQRLFAEHARRAELVLRRCVESSTGVIVATYTPATRRADRIEEVA
jgi:dihydrofolate reductase